MFVWVSSFLCGAVVLRFGRCLVVIAAKRYRRTPKETSGQVWENHAARSLFLLVRYVFIRGIHIDGAPVYPCPQHPVIIGMPNRRGGLCVLFIHTAAPHPIQEHGQTEAAEADPFRSRCSQRSPSADSYTRCFYSPRESPSFALDICRMAHKWRNIRSRFGLS